MGDYGAIVSTLVRIQHAMDHQDREAFRACWTEDAQVEMVMFDGAKLDFNDRDDLIVRTTGAWTGQAGALRHVVGGVEVTFTDPAAAQATFYCSYIDVGAAPGFAGLGEYRDDLVKGADGTWRVKRRRQVFLTPPPIRGA